MCERRRRWSRGACCCRLVNVASVVDLLFLLLLLFGDVYFVSGLMLVTTWTHA